MVNLFLLWLACTGNPDAGSTSFVATTGTCTPVLDGDGRETGVELCPDGTHRRYATVACEPGPLGEAACPSPAPAGARCQTDADCTDGPGDGHCIDVAGPPRYDYDGCGCIYTCETDADCGAGEVCLCGGALPDGWGYAQCVPSSCATNDDCSSGGCRVDGWFPFQNCDPVFDGSCMRAADECVTDDDCGAPGELYCGFNSSQDAWTCREIQGTCD